MHTLHTKNPQHPSLRFVALCGFILSQTFLMEALAQAPHLEPAPPPPSAGNVREIHPQTAPVVLPPQDDPDVRRVRSAMDRDCDRCASSTLLRSQLDQRAAELVRGARTDGGLLRGHELSKRLLNPARTHSDPQLREFFRLIVRRQSDHGESARTPYTIDQETYLAYANGFDANRIRRQAPPPRPGVQTRPAPPAGPRSPNGNNGPMPLTPIDPVPYYGNPLEQVILGRNGNQPGAPTAPGTPYEPDATNQSGSTPTSLDRRRRGPMDSSTNDVY